MTRWIVSGARGVARDAVPPTNSTVGEAALHATRGQWIVDTHAVPVVDTSRSRLDKVRAVLPPQSQRDLTRLVAGLVFVSAPALAAPDVARAAIERGWFESRPVRIAYRDRAGALAERTVRVESVQTDRAEIVRNCTGLEKAQPRQFKLYRVERATAAHGDHPTCA